MKKFKCTYLEQPAEYIESKDADEAMELWVARLTLRGIAAEGTFVLHIPDVKVNEVTDKDEN